MAWALARNLDALRTSIRRVWPNVTIYTIGDDAHKTRSSDHNPDDTSGSKAEQTDSDTRQEVKAIDVMIGGAFNSGAAMQLVNALVKDIASRNRLRYIIFAGKIWSASNGWVARPFDGDGHYDHVHISNETDDDNNAATWPTVNAIGGDDPVTTEEMQKLIDMLMAHNITSPGFPNGAVNVRDLLKQTLPAKEAALSAVAGLAGLRTAVDGLISVSFTDADAALLRQEMQEAEATVRAEIQESADESEVRDQQILSMIESAQTGGATADEVLTRIAELIKPA
jgi:hypothetical protein